MVALKTQIFYLTSESPNLHGFQATRWNLGTEITKRQCGREESPDINLPGGLLMTSIECPLGETLFHSLWSSSEHLWGFVAISVLTSDDQWRPSAGQCGAEGFKWHPFHSSHWHRCLNHQTLSSLVCKMVITTATVRCCFEDERDNPANLVHGRKLLMTVL